VAADVHAFALCGWAPVPALANVVDGPTDAVLRIIPGDPHPFALVRVLFNAALCRVWFGAGPWDALARTWAGSWTIPSVRQKPSASSKSLPGVRMVTVSGGRDEEITDERRMAQHDERQAAGDVGRAEGEALVVVVGLLADGGDARVVECDEASGRVSIEMLGACGGCPLSQLDFVYAIESLIRREVPQVRDIVSV
jgi:Fe-S cluster biogenesis protein NfuA